MHVYNCGTPCTLKQTNIEGEITALTIRYDSVEYEFTYQLSGEIKSIWVREQ